MPSFCLSFSNSRKLTGTNLKTLFLFIKSKKSSKLTRRLQNWFFASNKSFPISNAKMFSSIYTPFLTIVPLTMALTCLNLLLIPTIILAFLAGSQRLKEWASNEIVQSCFLPKGAKKYIGRRNRMKREKTKSEGDKKQVLRRGRRKREGRSWKSWEREKRSRY